jgi:hypothetical protein
MKLVYSPPSGPAAYVVWTLLVGSACGSRFEGGLANAPSIERRNMPRAQHDLIANGPESCPLLDGGDPFPYRVSECEEERLDAGAPRARNAKR